LANNCDPKTKQDIRQIVYFRDMKKTILAIALLVTAMSLSSCEGVSKYPISDAYPENNDDRIIGKWKVKEDSAKNDYYEITAAHPNFRNQYHFKVWDRGGTNPSYEGNCYFSKVGVTRFLNIPFHDDEMKDGGGYIFLRILEENEAFDNVTTTTVCDTNMRTLGSKEAVKAFIAKNLKNKLFYCDTAHLYKVK
jgi:hypothetical protein